jgi:hypothetical protein
MLIQIERERTVIEISVFLQNLKKKILYGFYQNLLNSDTNTNILEEFFNKNIRALPNFL